MISQNTFLLSYKGSWCLLINIEKLLVFLIKPVLALVGEIINIAFILEGEQLALSRAALVHLSKL